MFAGGEGRLSDTGDSEHVTAGKRGALTYFVLSHFVCAVFSAG
jgi:hypothetical protein